MNDCPHTNTALGGYERTVPAKSDPPNGYGVYDMTPLNDGGAGSDRRVRTRTTVSE